MPLSLPNPNTLLTALSTLPTTVQANIPLLDADNSMNCFDLTEELTDLLDRQEFEQHCREQESQYRDLLREEHHQVFTQRINAAEVTLQEQARQEVQYWREDAVNRLKLAESTASGMVQTQESMYSRQADELSKAAVRDIQGFYSEALAEHARGNSQEVQRALHSHYEKVQAEYGQRVNEIRSSLDRSLPTEPPPGSP